MWINKLELYHFRNYQEQKIQFVPGVNLIVGNNAQGKTNLLEAICYLSRGKSFRTRKEAELIAFDSDFCELCGRVEGRELEKELRMLLFAGRRPRQIYISGVKIRSASELSGILTTVLFCPEDLQILKTGSVARRRFLDNALCQLRPNYQAAFAEYQKLYEQKSRILKDRFENPSLLEVLPEYNVRMAQVGAILIYYRARYLQQLCDLVSRFHEEFSAGKEKLQLQYRTVSTIADPLQPVQVLYEKLLEHQQSHAKAELESMQCLSGPHKDDFDVDMNSISLKAFGSQGQIRTAAISLKLAEREVFKLFTKEEPVLLLDDVLSELDPGRQDFVLNKIKTGQVFITCCEKDRLTDIGEVFLIENGSLTGGQTV